MLRYQGVLAPHSAARAQVVPNRPPSNSPPVQLQLVFDAEAPGDSMPTAASTPPPPERRTGSSPGRHLWAWLLRRVFSVEVETCERCGGRMRVHQVAKAHAQIQSALFELGYSLRAPPSRAPPLSAAQLALPFG